MRRIIGLVASGLGTFLIVTGVLIHFVVVGQALKFPLGLYKILTYEGTNASYFSPASLTEVSGATVRLTQTLRGDVSAGTSSTSVWDQFVNTYDATNHQQVQYAQSRLAFDRRTAALTNCCGVAVGTDPHVNFSGLGVQFPIGSQKQTYNVFDFTLLKAVPAHYTGQATVDGLSAYKYVETVPPTQIGSKSVPGSLVGSKAAQVSLGEFYQTSTTYYVDSVTGTIVSLNQNEHIGLRDSTGAEKLVVFSGDVAMTPATQQSQVNTAKSGDSETSAVSTVIPLTAGIIGIVLLVLGIVLVLMSRGEVLEYEEE